MFDYEKFRINLILYRKKLKLTQEDLASQAELNDQNIGRLERGEHNPNLQTIVSLLNTFNTTPTAFMSEQENSNQIIINSINGYLSILNDKEKKFILKLIGTMHKEV